MRGQTLVLAIVILGLSSILLLGLFKVSTAARQKIRLQLSADLAVLSALNCQANGLNDIALVNRAILANDALAAQLNAMVSEITFYSKLAEKFKNLLQFIPYAGTVGLFLERGIRTIEKVVKRATSLILPLAGYSNKTLWGSQKSLRYLLPVYSLKAVTSTLKENSPEARLTPVGESFLLHQARSLQTALRKAEPAVIRSLRTGTMDRHTLKRNWRIKVAGLSPVEKTGGTKITSKDLEATDRLRLKVFKRFRLGWKTVLKTRSNASDLGYPPPEGLFSMDKSDLETVLSLPILIRTKMPAFVANEPFHGRELSAISAGKLVYIRSSKKDEASNVFNPFWKAELTPVAEDPTIRSFLPGTLLKEIRH